MRVYVVMMLLMNACAIAQEYDIFILAGQSNMDGRGKAADLPKELAGPQQHVRFFYRNPPHACKEWVALAPGYSIAPSYKGALPSNTFGPEINFGAQIAKALPNRRIALIKGSKGGTSLAKDWAPGQKGNPASQGPQYKYLQETLAMALDQLKKNGDTYVLRGMIWHQGESDAALAAEVYQQRLAEFIARIREDLNQPGLPFVIGEVFDNGKRDSIRTAQLAVSKSIPRVGFFSVKDLATWDKGTHFDAASQLAMGERFAAEMVKLLNAK